MTLFYTRILYDFIDDDLLLHFIIGFNTEFIGTKFIEYFNNQIDTKYFKIKNYFRINKNYSIKKYYPILKCQYQPSINKFIDEYSINVFDNIIEKIMFIANIATETTSSNFIDYIESLDIYKKKINYFIDDEYDNLDKKNNLDKKDNLDKQNYLSIELNHIESVDESEPKLAKITINNKKINDYDIMFHDTIKISSEEYEQIKKKSLIYSQLENINLNTDLLLSPIYIYVSTMELNMLANIYNFEIINTYRKENAYDKASDLINGWRNIFYSSPFDFSSNQDIKTYFSQEDLDLIDNELNAMLKKNIIIKNTSYKQHDEKFTRIYNDYIYKTYYTKLLEFIEIYKLKN